MASRAMMTIAGLVDEAEQFLEDEFANEDFLDDDEEE